MSKAKELAREIQTELELGDLNVGPRSKQLMYNLVDAVLSEPEPLRGWIECKRTDIRYLRRLVNLETGVQLIEIENQNVGCCLQILDTEDDRAFAESYDSIKQKIKEAS